MSYEVIARKYRPQKFADLIGQEPIAETLKNAIAMKKVSHAYLFSGPRGVGKTSVARILAKSLNCLQRTSAEPCGSCANCVDIGRGNSLDVVEIDGASNRGIDEIRELKEKVNYSPIRSAYRIYIIDEVHMLTAPAFNALLKTLEEPPPHIIFIFATTEAHLIPLTVLSRCQRFDFRRITVAETVSRLESICAGENVRADREALFLLAKNSDGSMRDAQSALDQLIAYSENNIDAEKVSRMFGLPLAGVYHDYIQSVLEGDMGRGLGLISRLYGGGHDLKLFVEGLTGYLRGLFLVKNGIEDEEVLRESPQTVLQLKEQAGKMEMEVISEMIRYLVAFMENFRYTSHFRVLAELSFFNLLDISQKVSLHFIHKFIRDFLGEEEKRGPAVSSAAVIGSGSVLPERPGTVPEETAPGGGAGQNREKNGPEKESAVLEDFLSGFIKKVCEHRPHIGKILNSAKLKKTNENEIVICVQNEYHIKQLNSPSCLESLKNTAKEVLNTEMRFRFECDGQAEEPGAEAPPDPRIDNVRKIFKGNIKKQ